jgi:type I restriction enzyme S subunit
VTITVPLKRFARLIYGDALASEIRVEGDVPVMGSGGQSGWHNSANTEGPTIVVGRKGSYGTIYWQPGDCFVIDTAYYVKPIVPGVNLRWLYYALQAVDLKGVSQDVGVPGLSREDAHEARIPVTQSDEQRRIANFLDAETARIDGLAAARRRMRDLLTLRRERTLEHLLALDTSPPMIPLKYVVQCVSVGIVITPANWYVDDGGVPALRGVNIKPGHIEGSNMVQISQDGHRENMKSRLSAGDVVVVRTGQAGAAAVVPNELDGCNCIDLLIIRPGQRTSASFLTHYLNSFYAQDKITEHSVGSIQAHFNVASMKNLEFPNIDLTEQQRRAAELDDALGELDLLNSQLDAQLELLTERRQALITAAVTGEITV